MTTNDPVARTPATAPPDRAAIAARSIRLHRRIGIGVLFLLIGGLGGWSALANISGAVIAPSIVVVESNAKRVQHLEGGIVAAINVKDGEKVSAGDVLIRLDQTETRTNLGIIDSQLNELAARLARLEAERDDADTVVFDSTLDLAVPAQAIAKARRDQTKLFDTRKRTVEGEEEQIAQRVTQLEEEIRGLKAQEVSRKDQLAFLEDELQGLRDLQKRGLVPKTRLLLLERQAAEMRGERGQFRADMARARGRIAELGVEAAQSKRQRINEVLTELRTVQANVAELIARRRAALDRLSRIEIVAPQEGFVHNLATHTIGGVIAPREPVLTIIPEKDALQLAARVDPADIHRVYRDQPVTIRFSSLDASRTPELTGAVTRVPAATTEADGQTPPFYVVRVAIADGEFAKLGGQRLKPGMPAEVYIETGERKAITFLMKPFLDALPQVFRGQ
ncbi:MAG: HlyD family type I secretion periplasmic adaptor subunit [Pseudomonadota bacterium]